MIGQLEILSKWKYLLVIFFAIGIVFAQTIWFDFVNYDDYDLVYQNSSYLSSFSNVPTSFSTHAFTTHRKESVYYRPILLISYIIDYHIWKLNPAGYHLTNIMLHFLTTMFVFLLIELIVRDKTISLLSSLLFAVHPIQVESVAWVAGRNDILLGLFIVLMMFFYIHHYENPEKEKIYFLFSVLSFTLALFTKESAAFFILLIPLYELSLKKISPQTLIKPPYLIKFLTLVLILTIYLFIRFQIFGEVIGTENLYGMIPLIGRLKLIPAILSELLSLILLPIRLSVEHPLDGLIWLENVWNLFAILLLAGLAVSIWLAWKMNRLIFFGLIWLCVGLLPTLNFFPLAVPILEHRLYTVIVGPVFIFGSAITAMRTKYFKNILMILIIAAALTSYLRSPVWQNSETLWRDAMQKAPTAHRPYFNLAGYYYDLQQFDKTITLLNKYIEIKPEDYTGYSKLRQTYYAIGDYGKAAQVCRKMISLAPHDPNRYIDLGIFFEKLNLPDSAIGVYSEGLRVDSAFYQLHVHLGRMYHNQNNLAEAKKQYRLAIQLKSDFAPAYFSLGVLEASQGNDSLALQLLEQGVKFEQPSADIKQAILYLREKTGYDWK